MGVACGVSGAGGHSGRERSEPGRLRHFVAPQHLVAHLRQAYYIPGDLSTGYPQLIATSYIYLYLAMV